MVSRIDDYTLGRTLGSGFSAKVKECMDANGTYAIKISDIRFTPRIKSYFMVASTKIKRKKTFLLLDEILLFDYKEVILWKILICLLLDISI